MVAESAREIEQLLATGRSIPEELLQCDPLPPIPEDRPAQRAGWIVEAAILHELCVNRAAAARALQRGHEGVNGNAR